MNCKKLIVLVTTASLALSFTGCRRQKPDIPDAAEAAVEVPAEEAVETQEPPGEASLSGSDLEAYDRIIEELDQYMADQDFENLFSAYSAYRETCPALSDKLEEKKTQYAEELKTIFDGWITEADELTIAVDTVNAKQKFEDIASINSMKNHFEELDIYDSITNERLSYYWEYNKYTQPANLMGKQFDTVDGCYYRDKDWGTVNKYEDRFGHSYDEYYELQVQSTRADRPNPYVIFNADNQYDIFHAEFVCHNRMKEYNQFHIEVYGDDTQLYVSDSFTSYNDPMAVDVEITGYRLIKFMAVREDYNTAWGEGKFPSVGLYQADFLYSEKPEFEYYDPQNQEQPSKGE